MLKNKKTLVALIVIILIALIVLTLCIAMNNKYSRDSITDLVKNSTISNNTYIENNMYENNSYVGVAKFYIKDNMEYIYQENKNQEKIETYINNESNTSTTVLHSERTITQNNNTNDNNFELPLKNDLLDKLNNTTKYDYTFAGKEKINEINCIKISLINNENNENCNYYIDENAGYIVQYENESSKNKEIYKYELNSVTDEQIKVFNLDDYSNYTFVNSI